ncbi:MAG: DUF2027 domain-containing protein [Bacteroidales bacterium]|nr:DUF2027 domain-containing protein [Bacteroidales bacterium]MBN2757477.1 DUF2027 domain-containing protein [Bacteroidales bacterium]
MKYNIGDKVKFLNEVGGGKVVKFIDNETVLVLNDDDFEIPVHEAELIPDNSVGISVSSNNEISINELTNYSNSGDNEEVVEEEFEKEDDNIYLFLAFVPENQDNLSDSDLVLHFINDSNYNVSYNLMIKYGAFHVSYPGNINANLKTFIKKFTKKEINDLDSLVFQAMFYKNTPHQVKPVFSDEIKFNPIKFFKDSTYTENDFFDEKAYLYSAYDETTVNEQIMPEISAEEIKMAMLEKNKSEKINRPRISKTSKSTEQREIDLHIHQLLDNYNGLSNSEMVEIQLNTFKTEMESAITDRVKKIIFIHGVGAGTLKIELRKELERNYKKYKFQDASFKEYGYGATMVYIS